MIHLFSKTDDFIENDKFANKNKKYKTTKFGNKKWKGVISEKIKVFPLVCSKYLSSWTGLGRSGHVQITTFDQISHVSVRKITNKNIKGVKSKKLKIKM